MPESLDYLERAKEELAKASNPRVVATPEQARLYLLAAQAEALVAIAEELRRIAGGRD
jgi:hypothetical protein